MGLSIGGIAKAIEPKIYYFVNEAGTQTEQTVNLTGLASTDAIEISITGWVDTQSASSFTVKLNDGSDRTFTIQPGSNIPAGAPIAAWGVYANAHQAAHIFQGGLIYASTGTQAVTMSSVVSCKIQATGGYKLRAFTITVCGA